MNRRTLLQRTWATAFAVTAGILAARVRTQAAQAQTRKILVIASNQDVPNFDPHIATGYSASAFLRNVYNSLVRVEGNPVKVVPQPRGVVDHLARRHGIHLQARPRREVQRRDAGDPAEA